MGAKIRNPWGDGRDAKVYDEMCCARPCLLIGLNKGSFTPGRGYTSYHRNPWLECMERYLRGCPHPFPDPEPELVRCCPAPSFATPRKGTVPFKQKCRTCGTWAHGEVLNLRRRLPQRPFVECDHSVVRGVAWGGEHCWGCSRCKMWWDKRPSPYQIGESSSAFSERRMRERKMTHGLEK